MSGPSGSKAAVRLKEGHQLYPVHQSLGVRAEGTRALGLSHQKTGGRAAD